MAGPLDGSNAKDLPTSISCQSHDLPITQPRARSNGDETGARPPRIKNACVACRRCKTKCSGGSAPCEACARAGKYCFFNPKLDTRRKVAYKPGVIQEHQQYILRGLLQTLKYGSNANVNSFLNLLRSEAPLDQVADNLCSNFEALRFRQLLPETTADNFDVVSLVLSDLERYRVRASTQRAQEDESESHSQNQDDADMTSNDGTTLSASQYAASSAFTGASHTSSDAAAEASLCIEAPGGLSDLRPVPISSLAEQGNTIRVSSAFPIPQTQPHGMVYYTRPQGAPVHMDEEFVAHNEPLNAWSSQPLDPNAIPEQRVLHQNVHTQQLLNHRSQQSFFSPFSHQIISSTHQPSVQTPWSGD